MNKQIAVKCVSIIELTELQTHFILKNKGLDRDQRLVALDFMKEGKDCPIVADGTPVNVREITVTPCLHVFNDDALDQWVELSLSDDSPTRDGSGGDASCPCCRTPIGRKESLSESGTPYTVTGTPHTVTGNRPFPMNMADSDDEPDMVYNQEEYDDWLNAL